MAFTAATNPVTIDTARDAVTKAEQALWLYRSGSNNPALLAQTDAACLAAITALTALRV